MFSMLMTAKLQWSLAICGIDLVLRSVLRSSFCKFYIKYKKIINQAKQNSSPLNIHKTFS